MSKSNHDRKSNHDTPNRQTLYAVAEVCMIDPRLATDSERDQIREVARHLERSHKSPDKIREFGRMYQLVHDKDDNCIAHPTLREIKSLAFWKKLEKAYQADCNSDGIYLPLSYFGC